MFEPCAFFLLRAPLLPVRSVEDRPPPRSLVQEVLQVMGEGTEAQIRMRRQLDPHGLFAGTAVGKLGTNTQIRLKSSTEHVAQITPDAQWMWQLAAHWESHPEIVRNLQIRTNPLVCYRESRAVLVYQNLPPYLGVSIGLNPLIERALLSATQPLCGEELIARIVQAFPEAHVEAVESLLQQLLAYDFLQSELRHSSPVADPTARLQRFATLGDAETIRSILEALSAYEQTTLGQGDDAYRKLVDQMRRLVDDPVPIHVSLTLRAERITLGHSVAEEAARIADVLGLLRIVTESEQAIQAYADRFVATYGEAARVPLSDLLDEDIGLGAPATYLSPPSVQYLPFAFQKSRWEIERERLFRTWLEECRTSESLELELTAQRLLALARHRAGAETARDRSRREPHSIELCLQIIASSARAVDRGEYRLILNNRKSAAGAGKLLARHPERSDENLKQMLSWVQEAEQALEPDALFAEVVYLPANKRMANLLSTARFRPCEILLDTFPAEGVASPLLLSDLVVGVEQAQFTLHSRSQNRRVIPTVSNRLNPKIAPNLYRFLHDLSTAGEHRWQSFSWGELEQEPFLPRVTWGRVVLSPARWRIVREDSLPFNAWMGQLPRCVQVWRGVQSILLDLNDPEERDVLQKWFRELKPGEALVVEEAWFGVEDCFVETPEGACLAECVIPLVRSPREKRDEHEPAAGNDNDR